MLQKNLPEILASLEFAAEQAGLGSWYIDVQAGTRGWSKSMYRLLGRNPSLGIPNDDELLELIHPIDQESMQNSLRQIAAGEIPADFDFRTRPDKPPVKTLHQSVRLDTDPTGKALKFFGSIQDVTDLRQQASRSSESERWLTMVQEHGLVGFWDWDMLTDRSSWSEQMEVLYGLQPGEGGIHVWESMVHPDDLQAAHAAARKVVQSGRRQLIEDYRIIRRDGRLGWILNYGLFSYDSSGKPVRMQGVSVDITQRKEAELALLLVEEFAKSSDRSHP